MKEKYDRILDVGCGTGAILNLLQPKTEELWGADISEEALAYCAHRGHKNLLQSDACHLDFPDEHFDLITAIGIIEHLDDDDSFLKEMSRLLKPSGKLILLTSSMPYLWTEHDVANEHKRRYFLKPLNRKIQSFGFTTHHFSHLNFFLFPGIALVLLFHRLFRGIKSEHPKRILPQPPQWINNMLSKCLTLEAYLMTRLRLPWGISMIGLFEKTHDNL